MSVTAVVYDIGNVLLEWNPERFYDRVIGPERRARLFAEVDLEGMNAAVDRGAEFLGSVMTLAEAHPGWADEIRLWHERWLDMASPAIEHSALLLRRLRARGVPVFALSNFGVDSFEIACRAYPVLTEFDRSFISGQLRQMKPEPAIYETLERETGVAPAELLFADDRPDNIAAAAIRGWQTHLFEHPEGWAARLVAEGLLAPEEASA